MDYDGFEQRLGRRAAARELLAEIDAERRMDLGWLDGMLPTDESLDALDAEWLPESLVVCLRGTPGACGGPQSCGERCTAAYWREHSMEVASMLEAIARALGEDERLWYVTGRLHDLDYLKGPHHDGDIGSDRSHPVAIARQMHERGMPVISVRAVLEHSPHLGLEPSSRLSHALIACDEHATMTADGQTPPYPDDVPGWLLDCLQAARPTIDGFVRDDMLDRAIHALRGLLG